MGKIITTVPRDVCIVLTLFTLSLFTRFYGLGEWAVTHDEYYTALFSAERSQRLINPAYYNLVVFSQNLLGENEFSLRLPSALLSTFFIPIFYLIWRNVFGRKIALLAAIVILLHGWVVVHGQYARFYSGVLLFGNLAIYCYYSALVQDKLKYLFAFIFFSVIACLFHATAALIPALCWVISLALMFMSTAVTGVSRRVAKIYLYSGFALAIAALPVAMHILDVWTGRPHGWYKPSPILIARVVERTSIPLVISSLFGLYYVIRDRHLAGSLISFIAIGLCLLFLVGIYVVAVRPDYIISIIPLLACLAAYACMDRSASAGSPHIAPLPALLLMVSLVPAFLSHFSDRSTLDAREPANFIEKHYMPGDRVLVFDPGVRYYLADRVGEIERDGWGNPHSRSTDWDQKLNGLLGKNRVWIVFEAARSSKPPAMFEWLAKNARLVWQKRARRFDAMARSKEVYLVCPESMTKCH